MAFKTEELMIQVLPGKEGAQGCPTLGLASSPTCQSMTNDRCKCRSHSQCPPDSHPCDQGTHPCDEQTGGPCGYDSGESDTCQNNTRRGRGDTTRPSGLDLLRHQMRERLSQELPS